jgi:hypothetical protein
MKRSLYPIPLAALALQTAGCIDPVSTTWEAATFDNIPMPFSFEYTNDFGQACTNTLSISMTVYNDLSAALFNTELVSCEGAAPASYTYSAAVGAADTVQRRAEYIIAFDNDFSLDCILPTKDTLECVDLEGATYLFNEEK